MRNYTPRRAGKRWLEGAPAYVLDVLDNKGKTADRYTVLFTFPLAYTVDRRTGAMSDKPGELRNTWIPSLSMSAAPTDAQGVSMWSETEAYHIAIYRCRSSHHRIRWSDLPEHIQQHVRARAESDD